MKSKFKIPKQWQYIGYIIGAALLYLYFTHKKQIQLEDAAQLVIGAPGPRQVSITNPNPVRIVAKPKAKATAIARPRVTSHAVGTAPIPPP
jgi:hypothetical protein